MEFIAFALRQPGLLALILFASLMFAIEIGNALARRRLSRSTERTEGAGLLDGAVFALLGLLLALSFTGAASRLDMRRQLIVQEANAIATARLRVDLLPADLQPPMQIAFDRYIRSRVEAYASSESLLEFRSKLRQSALLQQEIWAIAVAGGRRPEASPAVNIALLPALNAMIDITTTRAMALRMHMPVGVYLALWLSASAAALLAGYNIGANRARPWLQVLIFAAVVTLTLYMVIDMEYPRAGLIRLDQFDQVLLTGEP